MTNLQPTPHDSRKNDQLTITATSQFGSSDSNSYEMCNASYNDIRANL